MTMRGSGQCSRRYVSAKSVCVICVIPVAHFRSCRRKSDEALLNKIHESPQIFKSVMLGF